MIRKRLLALSLLGGMVTVSFNAHTFLETRAQLLEQEIAEQRLVDEAQLLAYEVEEEVEPIIEKITMEVTAYTAGYESTGKNPGHVEYGQTASGAYVKQGVTIAAGSNIPFGTKIYIPYFDGKPGFGDGVFTVQDRGGAIKAHNIDVYMESLTQAKNFGRQQLEVKILEENS